MKKLRSYFFILLFFIHLPMYSLSFATSDSDDSTNLPNKTLLQRVESNTDDHKNDQFMWSSLVMLTAPSVGLMLYQACQFKPSVIVFAGSTAYYMGMEIINWQEYLGGSEEEMAIYAGKGEEETSKEYKEKQYNALIAAADQTKKAKESVEKKGRNSKYAGMGFALAGGLALAEEFGIFKSKTCSGKQTDQEKSKESKSPLKESESTDSIQDKKPTEIKDDLKDTGSQKSRTQKPDTDTSLFQKNENEYGTSLTQVQREESLTLDFYQIAERAYHQHHSLTLDEYEQINKFQLNVTFNQEESYVLKQIMDSFFPQAQAALTGMEKMGVYGGTAAAVATWFFKDSQIMQWVSKSLQNGHIRAGLCFGYAGIAYLNYNELKTVATELTQRELEYRNLANALKSLIDGPNTNISGKVTSATLETSPILLEPYQTQTNSQDLCVTGSPTNYIPIQCSRCNQANNCLSSFIPSNGFSEFGTPSLYSDATGLLSDMQNAGYSGDIQGGKLASEQLGQYASKINKANDHLKNLINKKRQDEGKATIDWDKLTNQMAGRIKNDSIEAYSSLPGNLQHQLQELAGDFKKKTESKIPQMTFPGPSQDAVLHANDHKEEGPVPQFVLDSNEDALASVGLKTNETYNYNKHGDVDRNKHHDLFQIITQRYLKTAYPLLLEEHK